MAGIVDRLPDYAVPFVTRSLRRGRGRIYAALSFGLALLLLLTTLWIGLRHSEAAHVARLDLGMEAPTYEIEHHELIIVRHEYDWSNPRLEERQAISTEEAKQTVRRALEYRHVAPEHVVLHARAKALANDWEPGPSDDFSWYDQNDVYRLRKIVERGGQPLIVDHTDAVGVRGTLNFLALLTGGLLILLLTVVAPLLVALQQASERHDNTLQPLTGTALDARELMIGLACGPLAVVAIFAAPLAALFVFAAVAVGEFAALIFLPVLVGTAIGLVFGAQLLAQLLGARRAPWLIAVGLVCLLGFVALSTLGAATLFGYGVHGVSAVLPQSGLFALLGDGFGDCWRQAALLSGDREPEFPLPVLSEFLGHMLVGTLGTVLLGRLAVQAMARHVEGRDTLLGPGQALFGAVICIVMINVAMPLLDHPIQPFRQMVGLPGLALPFLLCMMTRVPIGDLPTKLRRIPLARLIGELTGWTLIHMIVAALLDQTAWGFHPVLVLGIAWCMLVIVLLAIRTAAIPGGLLGHIGTAFCLGMLQLVLMSTYYGALEPSLLSEVLEHPEGMVVIGAMWLLVVVLVPLTLLRYLRNNGIRLSVAEPSIPPQTR